MSDVPYQVDCVVDRCSRIANQKIKVSCPPLIEVIAVCEFHYESVRHAACFEASKDPTRGLIGVAASDHP
ncbi:hypothetical protein GCM10009563_09370 [Subtercola frigoramans]